MKFLFFTSIAALSMVGTAAAASNAASGVSAMDVWKVYCFGLHQNIIQHWPSITSYYVIIQELARRALKGITFNEQVVEANVAVYKEDSKGDDKEKKEAKSKDDKSKDEKSSKDSKSKDDKSSKDSKSKSNDSKSSSNSKSSNSKSSNSRSSNSKSKSSSSSSSSSDSSSRSSSSSTSYSSSDGDRKRSSMKKDMVRRGYET